jgi:hypothetical protein
MELSRYDCAAEKKYSISGSGFGKTSSIKTAQNLPQQAFQELRG